MKQEWTGPISIAGSQKHNVEERGAMLRKTDII